MKIIYRDHRGSLSESMKTVREFNSVEDMFKDICKDWDGYFSEEDLVVKDSVGADDRIGWENVHHVCTKRMGEENYETPQCVGMCTFIEE